MKIRLKIFKKGNSPEPREEDLQVGAGVLYNLTVCNSDIVKASLIGMDGDEAGDYVLQCGKNPDKRMFAEFQGGASSCPFWDGDGSRPSWKSPLFQGIMGNTYLYLSSSKDGEYFDSPLAEVVVEDDSGKKELYDEMVRELLGLQLPHFVLDDFKGQMKFNKFSMDWEDGYMSRDDPDVMLSALERVVEDMRRPLAYINKAPHMDFASTERRRRVGQISRIDGRMIRGIEKAMCRLEVGTIGKLSDEYVVEPSRKKTYHTRVHAVIFTFLRELVFARLNLIKDDLSERIRKKKKDRELVGKSVGDLIKKLKNGNANENVQKELGTKRRQYAEVEAELETLRQKARLAEDLVHIVRGMLSYCFLSPPHEDLSVFDVPSSAFSGNEAYRSLYSVMLNFSRSSFWWVKDRQCSPKRLPKIVLSETGESRLQIKYSIVYENWCYARLLAAMASITGYQRNKDEEKKEKDSLSVVFENRFFRFKLVHGVTAQREKQTKFREFVCSEGTKSPDFAILITNKEKGYSQWVVADAKSDDGLREHIGSKREAYANSLEWKPPDRPTESLVPLASIIFLSGKASDVAAIEVPPPAWKKSGDEQKKFEDRKKEYQWDAGGGFVETIDRPLFHGKRVPFQGHVNANVSSVKKTKDVFREFLLGLERTVSRLTL